MVWFKFGSLFKCIGKFEKNREDCSGDVNEEYKAAHRTKSYKEMSDKVDARVRQKSWNTVTSSASFSQNTHLSDYVFEPWQETAASMIEGSDLHPLIVAYFQNSFEACNTCGLLLQSVQQVRNNYQKIQTVIKLSNGISDHRSYTNAQFRMILDELASFTILSNLLMTIKPSQFRDIHNSHGSLLRRLTKFINIQRKGTSTRFSPAVIACSFGSVRRSKLINRGLARSSSERLGAELDVAAKGVFIMINEFDTMSQLVKRLQDEIEHNKAIADLCVKNGKGGEMLVEVVKEFQVHQMCFLDQLEELEEHIYLCFLTINRSRIQVTPEEQQNIVRKFRK